MYVCMVKKAEANKPIICMYACMYICMVKKAEANKPITFTKILPVT